MAPLKTQTLNDLFRAFFTARTEEVRFIKEDILRRISDARGERTQEDVHLVEKMALLAEQISKNDTTDLPHQNLTMLNLSKELSEIATQIRQRAEKSS